MLWLAFAGLTRSGPAKEHLPFHNSHPTATPARFAHVQHLDPECLSLSLHLAQGGRPPSAEATPLRLSRALEQRVADVEGPGDVRHWLQLIGHGEEAEWMDLGTVRRWGRARWDSADVYEGTADRLCLSPIPASRHPHLPAPLHLATPPHPTPPPSRSRATAASCSARRCGTTWTGRWGRGPGQTCCPACARAAWCPRPGSTRRGGQAAGG